MSSSSHPIKIYHPSKTRVFTGMAFLLFSYALYHNLLDAIDPARPQPTVTLIINLFMAVVTFKHAVFKKTVWEITDTGINKMFFFGFFTHHYNWADIAKIENSIHPMLNRPAIGITVSDGKSGASAFLHILLTMQTEPESVNLYDEIFKRREQAQSA